MEAALKSVIFGIIGGLIIGAITRIFTRFIYLQINNSLVFPGAFKGMLEANIPQFKIEMFSTIAQALADSVKDLSPQKIIPTMWDSGVVELVSETIKKFK